MGWIVAEANLNRVAAKFLDRLELGKQVIQESEKDADRE